jgi:peptide deformylase
MLAYVKNPKNGGIGLAAPQVGVNKRIIIAGLPKKHDDESYPTIVMINPVILKKSPDTSVDEEGCLSLP